MAKPNPPLIPADDDRLYPISPHGGYQIVCGRIENYQVLVFPTRAGFLILRFHQDGRLVDSVTQPVQDIATAAQVRADWLASQGFKSQSIAVKRFYLPKLNVGVKQLTDSMREAIENPEQFHPAELEEIYSEIPGWVEAGLFVLCWNEDYYVDRSGQVVSS
jgi:hypothetical protein